MDRVRSYEEPVYLLDTAALNDKYDDVARHDNPFRWWTGSTRIPYDCLGESLKVVLYERGWKFLEAMDKREWTLVGELQMGNPHVAYDDIGLPDLSLREILIKGMFKYEGKPGFIRTELDPAQVLWEPDANITAKEALKAWGHN